MSEPGSTASVAGSLARHVASAAAPIYDCLIIGGGVYGVALLFEAARRGQRALLLEAEDFGGATTWHSLRILHGGLRYLQSADLGRFRQSVLERRWFFRHFPDLSEPLDCLMPLYGNGMRRPTVFRLAFLADALLSVDRNRGVDADHHLAPGRVISAAAARAQVPALASNGLQGAAVWQDGGMGRSATLLIEWLRWAVALGGTALSRMRVLRLTQESGKITGVVAEDGMTGDEVSFRATRIVNAAGPWCREFAATADRDRPELFHPSLAFNLLLDQPPPAGKVAVAVEPGGMGTLFLHPHQGRILVGTRHLPYAGPLSRPAAAQVPEAAVDELLGALNQAFPAMRLTRDAVVERRAGYLPAIAAGSDKQAKRPIVVDHGAAGGPAGLYSVSGVKWTTARAVAATFFADLGMAAPVTTPGRPPSAGIDLAAAAFLALDDSAARDWVAHMRRELAAATIEDIMQRRTGWEVDPLHAANVRARLAALWHAEPMPLGMVGA